jgi:tRNA splicing ligase
MSETEEQFSRRMRDFVYGNPDLVRPKPVLDGKGYMLKYRKNVFFKNLWGKEILECRGLIVDAETFEPIQRPFTKIFSQSESFAPVILDDELVYSFRKINGYMLSATIHNGELLLSTTGSTDSPFVDFALGKFKHVFEFAIKEKLIDKKHTTIFEVVDSDFDPHIISDQNGLWVLAKRKKKWNSEAFFFYGEKYHPQIHFPEMKLTTFREILEEVKTVKHEGFIVKTFTDGREMKLKSPYYSAIKWLARRKTEVLKELLIADKFSTPHWFDKRTNDLIKQGVIEFSKIADKAITMTEQEKVSFLRSIL